MGKEVIPDLDILFEPLTIGPLRLPNRIVMAPMTRNFAPGGLLHPQAPSYYARRAAGGAGLVLSEGTAIGHPVSQVSNTVPHFHGEAALSRWRAVLAAVHAAGGRMAPQLWHAGSLRRRADSANSGVPSIAPCATETARAMSERDIEDVVAAFAEGARSAARLGFDAVAVHGAHGYLLDQFLWPRTNGRSDRWGGSASNRARLCVEVVRAVRQSVGPDLPIIFRFSQWKTDDYDARIAETPQELAEILQPIADAGANLFDVSTRRFWQPAFAGDERTLAGWTKKLTGRPTIAVGSVGLEGPIDGSRVGSHSTTRVSLENLEILCRKLEQGEFDLVAVGRAFLANPEWGQKIRKGLFNEIDAYEPQLCRQFLEPSGRDLS